jgi:hypothetical protein
MLQTAACAEKAAHTPICNHAEKNQRMWLDEGISRQKRRYQCNRIGAAFAPNVRERGPPALTHRPQLRPRGESVSFFTAPVRQ